MKTQVKEIDVLGVNGDPLKALETYSVRVHFSFVEKESKTLTVPYPEWAKIIRNAIDSSNKESHDQLKNSVYYACILAAHENDSEVFS